MKKLSKGQLQKRENELFKQVDDLRHELYLHHHSPLYQLYSMHADIVADIRSLFVRRQSKKRSTTREQHSSITRLERQLRLLTLLSRSPYMSVIRWLRMAKWGVLSAWYSFRMKKSISSLDNTTYMWIVWGSKPYSESHTRSVSVAEQLAKKQRVIYIEPQLRNGYKPGYASLPVKPTLTVVQLKQVKNSVVQSLTLLLKSYKKSRLKFLVMSPEWLPYLKHIKLSLYVDIPHELVKIPRDKRYTTVGPHKKLGRIVVPNACDMELLKDASNTVETCDVGLCWIKRPVIGYIGDMDERIDEELIGKTAAAFPSATLVLVGNTNYRPVIAMAEKHENIFPVGQHPSHKLSLYLQSFDMLILPTRMPLKHSLSHESLPIFLSSGKPIICIASAQNAKNARNLIYRAKNHTDFIFQVEKALKESRKSKKRSQRVQFAQKLQWNVRPLLRSTNI